MVKSEFMNFVSKVWLEAGLKKTSGHSFRPGGVVALLLAGIDPNVITASGGWSSLAFLLYWRKLEDFIPLHIAKAYENQTQSELKNDIRKIQEILGKFQKQHRISNTRVQNCIAGADISDSITTDD